jgi:aspartate aminotransferase
MRSPSTAIRTMPRSGIREIFDLASTIPGAIHLEMGEPNFDTPAHIRQAAAEAAEAGCTKYTPNAGIPELRQAAAEKVRSRNGFEVAAEQIVVTPGAIAALFGCALALCDPGDEILISDPGWPNYRMIADLLNLRYRYYRLDPGQGMQPDIDEVRSLINARTKLIVLNSPSNPTGTVLADETARRLLDLADRADLWVVSDEVYDEMSFDGPVRSIASIGHGERVVSVYSFSKTYAMTGWRVGYAAAPQALAPFLVKTQEPTNACVNAPAQMAALAALRGPQDCVADMRDAYRHRRDEVLRILDGAGVPVVRPSGAFYMWVDIAASGLTDMDFARNLLLESHVAVTPGSAFGPAGSSSVRISLATRTEDLVEGVTRLANRLG